MKKSYYLFMVVICTMMAFCINSCTPNDPETPATDITEDKGDKGDNNDKDEGDEQQTAGTDVFQAFDQKGNEFYFYRYRSNSYVSYGSGRQHSEEGDCCAWEVVSVSGSEAKLNQYYNFDFAHPTTLTFSRGSNGALYMNNKQITNTQSPEFYGMSFSKKGTYEWKETYNASEGSYTNIFYTKSNGYTSTDNSIDITEIWNKYGLVSSNYTNTTSEPSSYSTQITLKSATTAHGNYTATGVKQPSSVTVTKITNDTYASEEYIKAHPGTQLFSVYFTHNGTSSNTWGYGLGLYIVDSSSNSVYVPLYNLSDWTTYLRSYKGDYGTKGGEYPAVGESDFSDNSHCISFYMTPEGCELCQANGALSFCVYAYGYGYCSEIVDASTFNITAGSSDAPARYSTKLGDVKNVYMPVEEVHISTYKVYSIAESMK